ncbi:hypothetical protein GPECTOR_13g814 [Gonium pectorale]|uniref:Pherophorin domain-containing protein n=1 Tax=Gonium pectorale TaxID=33097 RepID=A0A150GND3_GONPE|nr:hypothetical protein GPECTOR_13g814 [Gonium pectorale]|eukprot:KXZ51327.1 hypothetical protein GPECTOR_13g814 [Gonium pectorale]
MRPPRRSSAGPCTAGGGALPHLSASRLLLLLGLATALSSSAAKFGPGAGDLTNTMFVAGVEILKPEETGVYQDAQTDYWRTVAALPASTTPYNPHPTSPPTNFGCPASRYSMTGPVTFLITNALVVPGVKLPVVRSCLIPRNRPVIVNIFDDIKFYAPPLGSATRWAREFGSATVRLSPESLSSMAQSTVQRLNPRTCITASINGTEIPNIESFFHVAQTVNDLFVGPGFLTTVRDVLKLGSSIPGADDLYQKGYKDADFASAGYFLYLPKGFSKCATYTIRFGIRRGCTGNNSFTFWAKGTDDALPEGRNCWPNRGSCAGEFRQVPLGVPTAEAVFEYTITVF